MVSSLSFISSFAFSLKDNLFLNNEDLEFLRSIGISDLQSLILVSDNELQELTGKAIEWCKKVIYHSKLLHHSQIPVRKLLSINEIIWINSGKNGLSDLIYIDQNDNTNLVSNIDKDILHNLIDNIQPIILGNNQRYKTHPNNWSNFLKKNLLLGYKIDHDYLISVISGQDLDNMNKLNIFENILETNIQLNQNNVNYKLVETVIYEVRQILANMVQLKQDRSSAIFSSSVNNTANKPPKL